MLHLGSSWNDARANLFFFLFFGLSRPDLASNGARMKFLYFLKKISIFFKCFLGMPQVG